MSNFGIYNANDWTVKVGGLYITGVSEDMFSASKDEDFFSTSVGAQGDVIVNENNNELGTVKITLQQTSPQYNALLALGGTSQQFALWCTNSKLNRKCGGTKAMLKKWPEESYGAEAEDGEFEFQVFDYVDGKL